MDTIDANLEQLQMLFDNVVGTLRKEKEELRDAQECFKVVSTLTLCHTMHVSILSLLLKQEKQQCEAERSYEGRRGWQQLSCLPQHFGGSAQLPFGFTVQWPLPH